MFTKSLQEKINQGLNLQKMCELGSLTFPSNLIFGPMAGISNSPFRLLMQRLGAGSTISELISAKAITYKNEKTKEMLKLHPEEKNVGLQLFGEEISVMAEAAKVAESFNPTFIDLNLGCPVRKVVTRGGGSALLKDPKKLCKLFSEVKRSIKIPLTIKIRTGWDQDSLNADKVIHIAHEEGIEFVSIHGRTRSQLYQGKANWDYIENLATNSKIPLVGNGDLHSPLLVKERMAITNCPALMIARGAIRYPFIFLESLNPSLRFTSSDYLEVIQVLNILIDNHFKDERVKLVQLRKHIVWFTSGYPHSAKFRGEIFQTKSIKESIQSTERYFKTIEGQDKQIDLTQGFLTSGHG